MLYFMFLALKDSNNKSYVKIQDCYNVIFWIRDFFHQPPHTERKVFPATHSFLQSFIEEHPFKTGKDKHIISQCKKLISILQQHPDMKFLLCIYE